MSGLKITVPLDMTDAMLVATDVAEADYGAIANSHAYAVGDRVMSASQHAVYQCVSAYTSAASAVAPQSDATHWLYVAPTNRWKIFDDRNLTRTAQATSFYYRIKPGTAINALYAVSLAGSTSVRVRLTDPTYGLVYDNTVDTSGNPASSDWWSFFMGDWSAAGRLAAFEQIPSYPNAELRIDFAGTSDLACGKLVFGQQTEWGMGIQAGAKVGIKDYSRKETSDFGDPILVQRAYAQTNDIQLPVANADIDALYDFLASVRTTPCLYVSGARTVNAIYGIYQDFSILINYSTWSDVEISLLGLT